MTRALERLTFILPTVNPEAVGEETARVLRRAGEILANGEYVGALIIAAVQQIARDDNGAYIRQLASDTLCALNARAS